MSSIPAHMPQEFELLLVAEEITQEGSHQWRSKHVFQIVSLLLQKVMWRADYHLRKSLPLLPSLHARRCKTHFYRLEGLLLLVLLCICLFIYFSWWKKCDWAPRRNKVILAGFQSTHPTSWGNINASWWTEKWGVRGWKNLLFAAFVVIFFFFKDIFEQLSAWGWSQAFILPRSLRCLHKSMQSQNICNQNSAPGYLFICCNIVHLLYILMTLTLKGRSTERSRG